MLALKPHRPGSMALPRNRESPRNRQRGPGAASPRRSGCPGNWFSVRKAAEIKSREMRLELEEEELQHL